ncbi:hypothetical protein SAMN05421665_1598 [Yoonia rosea]|uniref:Uncharacterized protein n=1 Tax=Yoonia rosea TaxID=287098 RepID=A0A1R3WY17_9RHOB|nr:hypothetical protein [Yoonia rosea]SIT83088.1 hypothetical protein SAMN05421665_1598 [Yoonia rosea]
MYHIKNTLKLLRSKPSTYLIIHYSSQSLFDEVENAYSPRITSIVVMFFENRQTTNFSLHAIAEELDIPRENVEEEYDQIEKALLERFFGFAQNHFDKCWLHWNMRNTVFGFEHLEHRFRVLVKKEPPTIPFDNRVNVSDILKYNYGPDYAPDPRMLKLMEINGTRDPRFLTGEEEASAFGRKEFIRMNSSTISKVEFFRYVLERASKGKLKTAGRSLPVRMDRALESRPARVVAFISAMIGIPAGLFALFSLF